MLNSLNNSFRLIGFKLTNFLTGQILLTPMKKYLSLVIVLALFITFQTVASDTISGAGEGEGTDRIDAIRKSAEKAITNAVLSSYAVMSSVSKEREFLEFARTQANAIVGGKPATVWLQTDQGLIRFYEVTSIEKMGSSYKASVRLSVATKELSSYFPDGRFSDQPKSRFGDPAIYAESSSSITNVSRSEVANNKSRPDLISEVVFGNVLRDIHLLKNIQVESDGPYRVTDLRSLERYRRVLKPNREEVLTEVFVKAYIDPTILNGFYKTVAAVADRRIIGGEIKAYGRDLEAAGSERLPFFWMVFADVTDERVGHWSRHLGDRNRVSSELYAMSFGAGNYRFGNWHLNDFKSVNKFTFPAELANEVCEDGDRLLPGPGSQGGKNIHKLVPTVRLQMYGANDRSIAREILSIPRPSSDTNPRSENAFLISEASAKKGSGSLYGNESLRFIEYSIKGSNFGKRCLAMVDPIKNFRIVVKMPEKRLRDVDSAKVALVR